MKKITAYLLLLVLVVIMLGIVSVSGEEATQAPTTKKVQPTTKKVPTTTKAKSTLPKAVTSFQKKKVKIKSVTLVNKKKLEIKWKKDAGVKGYVLYAKKNGGKLKAIKTINNPKTTVANDTKARYGNKYTYYVRGFMKYKGKTYYTSDKSGYFKNFKTKKVRKKKYTWICDMNGKKIKDPRPFLKNPRYSLRVNVVTSTMTVFAKDGARGYKIPVHVYLIAGNTYDTAGTYKLGPKYRFRGLYYNSHSQWSARIYEDILFHTCLYTRSQDPNSLSVKTYNKLGTPSSHGCIRLQCVAAKFVYDKCPVGTQVVLTKSKNPGPLGKPKLEKIKKWHTWDPTDPTMKWKCKKHHCKHKEY